MVDQLLFNSEHVKITPSVARFGNTSYQIANIGSVAVSESRLLNPLAILVVVIGAGLLIWGDDLLKRVAFGVVCVGILIQVIWPAKTFSVVLKTSSADIQALQSKDKGHVYNVKEALEEAFRLRT